MRLKVGETLRLFNEAAGEWRARVIALKREEIELVIEDRLRLPEPEPAFVLLFALLKRSATELVVMKATELGASRLIPLFTARSVAQGVNLPRLTAIATEAAEQCERLSVPEITPPRPLAAALTEWPEHAPLAVALERAAEAQPAAAFLGEGAARPRGLLIGPEGGFTEAERALIAAHPAALPFSFGPRILRAETAAIAGLALFLLTLSPAALAAGPGSSHLSP
jgi:16S rRNA (uracil1498-N3)-methyltransferase